MNKDKRIYLRVSANEKKEIKRLADALGYNSISDYLCSISLSGLTRNDRVLLFREIHYFRMKNIPVENNINQIAKHLNTFKIISDSKLEEYLKLFRELNEIRHEQNILLKSLNKKISEL